jgi:hypothetical protein
MSNDRDEEKRKMDQEFGPPTKTIRVSAPGVDFSEFTKAQGHLTNAVRSQSDAWINGKWKNSRWIRFEIFCEEMIVHALRATIIVVFGAAIVVMGLLFVTEIVVTMPHWLPVLLWTLRAGWLVFCLLMLVLIGYVTWTG